MALFYNDFICDEINIALNEFQQELENKFYEYPDKVTDEWEIEKKIEYLNLLENGYPDIGIIVDIKSNGKKVIIDGIERCRAIEILGNFILTNKYQKFRIFELRGSNEKKMDFLRYYNFNGKEKSESKLRKLIYGEYIEYKILEHIEEIFKIISSEVTIDFLLKILAKVTINEVLEDNDLISKYLNKNMHTFNSNSFRGRFYTNFEEKENLVDSNIHKLISFLFDKLERYESGILSIYNYNLTEQINNLKKNYKLLSILNRKNSINDYYSELDNFYKGIQQLKSEKEKINLNAQSLERDFYKYIKNKEEWKKYG